MIRLDHTRRVPGRGVLRSMFYDVSEFACHVAMTACFRMRLHGTEHVPRTGPFLVVSNHQSFLDPLVNGGAARDRQLGFVARSTLYDFRPFAWLIASYGAIPIKPSGGDAAAMRAALRELEAGRTVLVYPEGSRSPDGATHEFKRGAGLLLKRAHVPVLPMAVEGTFDAWPRNRRLPRLGARVAGSVAPAIAPDELLADGLEVALERLRRQIETMRLELRRELRERTGGRWPRPGPGDVPYWDRSDGARSDDAAFAEPRNDAVA